jgi:hypothetical protein
MRWDAQCIKRNSHPSLAKNWLTHVDYPLAPTR